MCIEVINEPNASNTVKGNLLETLAEEFLRTQGYEVSRQVRVTASELDLLCRHKVSRAEVYVECKAHKDKLSSTHLRELLGTVELHDYTEGWLISTGPLGKDAKGFQDQWEKKPQDKSGKLRIYSPDRVLDALLNANIICPKPTSKAEELFIGTDSSIGKWTLLISPWGRYWTYPILKNGTPVFVSFCDADKGESVVDENLIAQIKSTDFSMKNLSPYVPTAKTSSKVQDRREEAKPGAIVEVEYGDKWYDYRPARPEHFVGRKNPQKELRQLFADIKKKRTNTRVLAITGDSGIGKSSLIAKVRDVANRSQKPSNLFLYAVDVRAANDASYINSSLLSALRQSALHGFGCTGDLGVTDYNDPLQSESIAKFLNDCERKHELIIVVFDQFEELYSKADLFPVFEEVKKLMFSAVAAASNLVLGFAWKTDSTVPQDHPAYHMWHKLSDHRFEVNLKPFSHSDAEQSLKIFEDDLGQKIRGELRKYLLENSQGYPWLLKKLCIHFYEQLRNGVSQQQMANRSLDISSLFDQDLNNLTDAQMGCLKLVARNAPMDWYVVLETTDHEIVQSLQNKRLLIRRGDKLNLYWDIFRDYVLTGKVPSISFTYIPQSPSLDALLRISMELDDAEAITVQELSGRSKLRESTIRNILHDLEEFGIISISGADVKIDSHASVIDERSILSAMRLVFKRHALVGILRKHNSAIPATVSKLVAYLKDINPAAQYHTRTWKTYARKLSRWLEALGLIVQHNGGFIYSDRGDIVAIDPVHGRSERRKVVFIGETSPSKVVEALDIVKTSKQTTKSMKNKGYRNACGVLYRFRLIELTSSGEYRVLDYSTTGLLSREAVWNEAGKEESLKLVIEQLREGPTMTQVRIGELVAQKFGRKWKKTSLVRIGGGLYQWAKWLMTPTDPEGQIPNPPGRSGKSQDKSQLGFL